MRIVTWLLAASLLLTSAAASAAQVTGLFRVNEALLETDDTSRDAALSQAFGSMVWKLTGLKSLEPYPNLQAHAAAPQAFIIGYTHRNAMLSVQFDAASMLRLLQDEQLPVLGMQRPLLLLWWTQQDLHGQQLVGDGHQQAEALTAMALDKGLPVRLPLSDLQEQMLTDSLEVMGTSSALSELQQRYATNAFVRVHVDGNSARWTLVDQGKVKRGQARANDAEALQQQVFTQIADYVVQQYAILPGQGDSLHIQVNGLDMMRLDALEKLLAPYNAKLLRLDGRQGVWQVQALPEQLRALFALQRLHELPVITAEAPAVIELDDEELLLAPTGTGVEFTPGSEPEAIDMVFSW